MNHKPNILVVGSFVLDQIARTRVFPRAGETVLGESFQKAPGGKGANQAVQIARLGAEVTMLGKLGRDANADIMLDTCRKAGIHTEHIMFDEDIASGCSMIILEETPGEATRNRIIVIPGSNMTIRPEDIAFLKTEIGQYDFVILQLEIPMEINELVCQYAFDAGVPVMLNPAPSAQLSAQMLSRLTYISPNESEAENLTGIHIDGEGGEHTLDDARSAALALRSQGAKNVIITLGGNGAVLMDDNGFWHSPCVPHMSVMDPTAAGDSFVGAFCTAACLGMSTEDALLFANHAAAITVSRMGAMPSLPALGEVRSLLRGFGKDFAQLDLLEG